MRHNVAIGLATFTVGSGLAETAMGQAPMTSTDPIVSTYTPPGGPAGPNDSLFVDTLGVDDQFSVLSMDHGNASAVQNCRNLGGQSIRATVADNFANGTSTTTYVCEAQPVSALPVAGDVTASPATPDALNRAAIADVFSPQKAAFASRIIHTAKGRLLLQNVNERDVNDEDALGVRSVTFSLRRYNPEGGFKRVSSTLTLAGNGEVKGQNIALRAEKPRCFGDYRLAKKVVWDASDNKFDTTRVTTAKLTGYQCPAKR